VARSFTPPQTSRSRPALEIAAGDALRANMYPTHTIYGIVAIGRELAHVVEENAP